MKKIEQLLNTIIVLYRPTELYIMLLFICCCFKKIILRSQSITIFFCSLINHYISILILKIPIRVWTIFIFVSSLWFFYSFCTNEQNNFLNRCYFLIFFYCILNIMKSRRICIFNFCLDLICSISVNWLTYFVSNLMKKILIILSFFPKINRLYNKTLKTIPIAFIQIIYTTKYLFAYYALWTLFFKHFC